MPIQSSLVNKGCNHSFRIIGCRCFRIFDKHCKGIKSGDGNVEEKVGENFRFVGDFDGEEDDDG